MLSVKKVNIYTEQLSIGYGQKVVQTGVTLQLMAGEMVCLLGPNGCGKSTLLRTLAGLQPSLGGTWQIADGTETRLEKLLALVLTERVSLDNTSVHDVVAMGRYPYTSFLGGLSETDERVIQRAIADVSMTDKWKENFNALSDGEKQRVLIAKAIAQETPIILLDEPTAHLDLPNRIQTLQLLRRLAHEGNKTILISTHELELALTLSDRILLMSADGVALDTTENLKANGAFERAFRMDIFNPLC